MMDNAEQVLTVAAQYREQLSEAMTRDDIRERMEWYRHEGIPLFKPPATD